jgi:hypothetical protein
MANLTKEEKEAMEQAAERAIERWLDRQFLTFGRWSAKAIAALALCALLYFILKTSGWSAVKETLTQ